MWPTSICFLLCWLLGPGIEGFVLLPPIAPHILKSDRLTDWGEWNAWANCPPSSYAVGFRLKYEKHKGHGLEKDDTALNQIFLICESASGSNELIQSGRGPFGQFGKVFFCQKNSWIKGFQLYVEPNNGESGDNRATANFAAICTDGHVLIGDAPILEGGRWSDQKVCPETDQAVCAIKTQIEANKNSTDKTGLNNIELECCTIHQLSTTAPTSGTTGSVTDQTQPTTTSEAVPGTTSADESKIEPTISTTAPDTTPIVDQETTTYIFDDIPLIPTRSTTRKDEDQKPTTIFDDLPVIPTESTTPSEEEKTSTSATAAQETATPFDVPTSTQVTQFQEETPAPTPSTTFEPAVVTTTNAATSVTDAPVTTLEPTVPTTTDAAESTTEQPQPTIATEAVEQTVSTPVQLTTTDTNQATTTSSFEPDVSTPNPINNTNQESSTQASPAISTSENPPEVTSQNTDSIGLVTESDTTTGPTSENPPPDVTSQNTKSIGLVTESAATTENPKLFGHDQPTIWTESSGSGENVSTLPPGGRTPCTEALCHHHYGSLPTDIPVSSGPTTEDGRVTWHRGIVETGSLD